jgi:hypothetical protein
MSLFRSDEERRAVVKAWGTKAGIRGGLLGGLIGGMTPLARPWMDSTVVRIWPTAPRWASFTLSVVMLSMLLGAMAGVILRGFTQQSFQRFVRSELIARGIRVCVRCGYCLTGNTSGVCPECGTSVAPATSA